MRICKKDTPVLVLKIIKSGMGVYIWPSYYVYGLNNPFCLFDHIRDTSVIYEKAKLVSFIYMQPYKVKFKSVQINMKLASYSFTYQL